MKLNRLAYLIYYLKNEDMRKLRQFFKYVKIQKKYSSLSLIKDVIVSSLKYNVSISEYFYFKFFELDEEQRETYAGTGFMYEYQLIMNPKLNRSVFENKAEFHKKYHSYIKYIAYDIKQLRKDNNLKLELLNNPTGKVVLKNSFGQCGQGIRIFKNEFFKEIDIIEFMEKERLDLAEEFLEQHPALMQLSPSGVNTVRVITQINSSDKVEFLGARLRISQNSHIDNLAAGNLAAPIDIDTGIVIGPGVYSDITKEDVSFHPVTGIPIIGFQVPFWPDIIDLVKKAAVFSPENRSIGWDVAVTDKGPDLIEGNHNWGKLLWQLPVKKGLKAELDHHLSSYIYNGRKNLANG